MTHRKQAGFTLIELVGVLAVLAVLAAVIVPPVIEAVSRAAAEAEEQNLKRIAAALEAWIRRHGEVPGAGNWARAAAEMLGEPYARIARNARGHLRGYYADPRFFGPNDAAFSGYRQSGGLAKAPMFPRIVLVSDLTRDAPPAPRTHAAFDAIWEQTPAAAVQEGPLVKIQRLELAPLFHRVVLVNRRPDAAPRYRLGTAASVVLARGPVVKEIWVLEGTKLSLYADPAQGGALAHALIVHEGLALLYGTDGSQWYWGRP